tara:strand:- start:293 stop:1066 length:774 start_codon:yes stop_codon:yes gene_type:complete
MLQAAQLLNGSKRGLQSLSASEVFNSILPKVNIDTPTQQTEDPNAEILQAQEDTLSGQAEVAERADNKRELRKQQMSAGDFLGGNQSNEIGQTLNSGNSAQSFEGISSISDAKDLSSFVKSFEGFVESSTPDGRQNSIGFGTKARKGEGSISREDAETRLGEELGGHRQRVIDASKRGGYNFGDAQIDALTSFDFNTGKINQLLLSKGSRRFSDNEQIASKMREFDKANLDGKGLKPLRGLTRRRKAESSIFIKNSF